MARYLDPDALDPPPHAGETHETTSTTFRVTKTATVNGTTLAYREQGEGDPVVFVHGGLSDLRTWEQQLSGVGRSYRAITYSRRFARPNEDIDPGADGPMLPHVDDHADFLREIDAASAIAFAPAPANPMLGVPRMGRYSPPACADSTGRQNSVQTAIRATSFQEFMRFIPRRVTVDRRPRIAGRTAYTSEGDDIVLEAPKRSALSQRRSSSRISSPTSFQLPSTGETLSSAR